MDAFPAVAGAWEHRVPVNMTAPPSLSAPCHGPLGKSSGNFRAGAVFWEPGHRHDRFLAAASMVRTMDGPARKVNRKVKGRVDFQSACAG